MTNFRKDDYLLFGIRKVIRKVEVVQSSRLASVQMYAGGGM